jgi:hypothetical protein
MKGYHPNKNLTLAPDEIRPHLNLEPLSQRASVTLFFPDSKIDMLDAAPCDETWPQDWVPTSFKMTWFD